MEEEKVFVSTKWLLELLVVAALALGSNYLGIAAKIMELFLPWGFCCYFCST